MKKRVISFILCLCTIVALMPTSAFAASLISIIRPTVTAPAIGQKPSYSATLPSTASTEVKKVEWSGELDSSGCFKSGVAYTVRVTVAVQAGQDKIISTTASKNILVNGKQAQLEWVSADQKQATVAYTFPTLSSGSSSASIVIKNIAVYFPDPMVGSAPPTAAQATSGLDSAYVKDIEWVSDYDGDVFVDNKDFTVYVTLAVKDPSTTTFNLVKSTINGDAAKIESISADKTEAVISTKYTSKTSTSFTAYASLSVKFPDPTVGSVPPTAAQTTLSLSDAYVKDVTWVSDYDGDVFVDNKDFTVYVTVALKDGVTGKFQLSNPKINGVTAKIESISGDNREVVLSTTYTSKTTQPTPTTYTDFTIKFPDPTVGKTPPTASKTTVSVSSAYVKDVQWVSDYDGDVFENNRDYTVYVTIAVRNGYIDLLNPKKVTINGVTAKIESISADKKEFVVSTEYTSKNTSSTAITSLALTVPEPLPGYLPASHTEAGGCPSNAQVTKFVWNGISQGSHFLNGKAYSIDITVKIKSGYDSYFDLSKVTVNGATAKVKSVSSDKTQVVISYTFPATDQYSGAVNRVEPTITAPAVGATPATTATIPASASTMVKKVEWIGNLDSNGKFAAGESYTVKLTMGMKPEYKNKTFNITDVSINGKDAKLVSTSSDKKEIVISYTFPKLDGTSSITNLAITFPTLAVGSTPPSASQTKVSNSSAYVKDVEWISDYDGDVFLDDKDYSVYVTVGIKSGEEATFKLSKATINGETATIESVSSDKKEAIISFEFTSKATAPSTVNEVAVTIPSPMVGKTPAGTSDLTIANKTDTYVKDIMWVSDYDGNTFQAGKTYIAYVTVAIKDGVNKTFALNKATLNGTDALVDSISADKKQVVLAGAFVPAAAPTFTDVTEKDWFYPFVTKVCSVGQMTGTGNGKFNPNGNLSLAEVMVLASNMHADHTKNDIPKVSGEWYMTFYSYCQKQGLLDGLNIGEKDLKRPATRYEMVAILDRAVSKDKTSGGVNNVNNGFIPDVKESDTYGEVVYRWYRSGIVTGDSERKFNGSNSIKRSEVSVILCQLLELVDRSKI